MAFALIDPNWNEGDLVVLETVAANEQAAVDLAETDKGVSLWSGYSEFPLPGGTRGSIESLRRHGFRIAEIEISIKESAPTNPKGE